MKRLLFALSLLAAACGQVNESPEIIITPADYPQVETFWDAQGTAVSDGCVFRIHDKGGCVAFDLKTKELLGEFRIGSYGRNNHCNVAFFGEKKYDESDRFPLLYVSQAKGLPVEEIGRPETDTLSRLVFVERIHTDSLGRPCGASLEQVIDYRNDGEYTSGLWITDIHDQSFIYCYGNNIGNCQPGNRVSFRKFRFPEFSRDRFVVTLTDEDIVDYFYYDEFQTEGERGPQNAILQGGMIVDGVIILPCGAGSEKYPAEFFVANMKNRKSASFDFTLEMHGEPEDVDVWGDRLICDTNDGNEKICPIWSLPLKTFLKAVK